jgi:predicted Zn finger-like uncharacterized protein
MAMVDEKYTRCPGCSTIFRVSPEQLAIREGQVRCGHCRTVFDGLASMVSLAPQQTAEHEASGYDPIVHGPATVTLRSAQALQPVSSAAQAGVATPRSDEAAAADDGTTIIDPEMAYASRFAWLDNAKRRHIPSWTYALAVPLLVVVIVGQAAYHYRDAIVAHWPGLRPALSAVCRVVGCEVRPLQEIGALSIEASDLQADPAHKGLLVLSATVRNRAPYALAYPMLELTLTDTQEHTVVRRAFTPLEYLNGTADAGGIAGNSELAVKLFIDASATTQAGYQVYLFYP